MMLALGAPDGFYYCVAAAIALINLLFILPGYMSKNRSRAALWSTLGSTVVAGFLAIWILSQLGEVDLSDRSLVAFCLILGSPFVILSVAGCVGIARWIRLPNP